jgi:hypothetical protein
MGLRRLHPRAQGDLGEASAIQWLTWQGAAIWLPLGHSPDYDVVAEWPDGRLDRVQVKTCTRRQNRCFAVSLCTRGGNQSWNGIVKRFEASRCDHLFVLVEDGRRWFIPSDRVEGTTVIILGGPKYAQFEVDPAPAL